MEAHLAALDLKRAVNWPATELVTSYSSLATAAGNLFRFDEAMGWIRQAQALSLPDSVLSVLYQHEAQIHFCMEDYVSSLHILEHGFKLLQQHGKALDVPKILTHYELLSHVMRTSSKQMPAGVAKAMASRQHGLLEQLRKRGYENPLQLPRQYVPGLEARPWYGGCRDEGSGSAVWARDACRAMRAAIASLRQEYKALKEADRLHLEGECIHSHHRGHWSRFEINAISETMDSGTPPCAVESPAACALFRRLHDLGVPVLRAPKLF